MKDAELITDLLLTEKKMSTNYNLFASECTNVKLRDTFVDMIAQGHRTQTALFETAQQKGWYKVEQAEQQKIDQAQQRFTNQTPTIG